jgi:hypothetical protein
MLSRGYGDANYRTLAKWELSVTIFSKALYGKSGLFGGLFDNLSNMYLRVI